MEMANDSLATEMVAPMGSADLIAACDQEKRMSALLKALQEQSEAVVGIHLAEMLGFKPGRKFIVKLEQSHTIIGKDIELCDRILEFAFENGIDIFMLTESDLAQVSLKDSREEKLPMTAREHPVLAIAYDENIRHLLANNLRSFNVTAVLCSTFREAEDRALQETFRGVLVDLTTIVKAKGEERVVACSLVNFFPVLRVKAVGSMLIPMTMAGDAKQENSLVDFLNKSCAGFTPRTLRAHKRREICLAAVIKNANGGADAATRGFARNISWGGMFIVDMHPEKFSIGDEIIIEFPDFGFSIEVVVINIQMWGPRKPPGVGVKFKLMDEALETKLSGLLKTDRYNDRDRLG